ncbi:DUF7504 family protein [Halosimplex amylolyticum]|uniref:DUF7504 family protein n=1 Tax=Halosimplex amylolyticum TaxID=3396616 RepID=UPI003F56C9F0
MSTRPDANGEDIEMPSNVLLLAPSVSGQESDVCGELLHGAAGRSHGLLITCMDSPAERLAAWTDHDHGASSDATVIDVETSARSAAAAEAEATAPTNAVVEVVPAEADLVDLGETVDRHLTRLTADGETAVCVHSVSDLLQRADERAVFKFLEVLTSSVDRADAVAHYHMNPDVHDAETVRTFEVLFDSVVDLRTASVSGE